MPLSFWLPTPAKSRLEANLRSLMDCDFIKRIPKKRKINKFYSEANNISREWNHYAFILSLVNCEQLGQAENAAEQVEETPALLPISQFSNLFKHLSARIRKK